MESNAKKMWLCLLAGLMTALIAAGCAGTKQAEPVETTPVQEGASAVDALPPSSMMMEETAASETGRLLNNDNFIHTVSLEGETLSIIAKWYTGELDNWKVLAEANPDIDPNRIFIGNEIAIPRELMITKDPLPQSFIDEIYAK